MEQEITSLTEYTKGIVYLSPEQLERILDRVNNQVSKLYYGIEE
jgi:hypothetical protein